MPQLPVIVNTALCCGDELCTRVCPAQLIEMQDGKAHVRPAAARICLKCGQCAAVCPKSAIQMANFPAPQPMTKLAATPEIFSQLAKSRRSIRLYKDKPVSRELLETLLDTARYAPTGKNRQDVEWVVVNGAAKMQELSALISKALSTQPGGSKFLDALAQGQDLIFRHAPCAVFCHASDEYNFSYADCCTAMTYLELMLPTEGLGCCWAGFATRAAQLSPEVREYLGVAEGRTIQAGLFLGYPAVRYHNVPPRRELRANWIE